MHIPDVDWVWIKATVGGIIGVGTPILFRRWLDKREIAIKEEAQKLQAEVQKGELELKKKGQENEGEREAIAFVTNGLYKTVEQVNQRLESQEARVIVLEGKVDSLQAERFDLQKEIVGLQSQIGKLEVQAVRDQQEIARLKALLSEKEKELQEATDKIAELEYRIAAGLKP